MSDDVISSRCRSCVEDVVQKGKFEFIDKESYGEYIQALEYYSLSFNYYITFLFYLYFIFTL